MSVYQRADHFPETNRLKPWLFHLRFVVEKTLDGHLFGALGLRAVKHFVIRDFRPIQRPSV